MLVRRGPGSGSSLLLLLWLPHGLSQGGTHVRSHAPPQVWPQSCNEPLCTSLLTACNMRNMPQQPDEP
ncbi:hypothetical protein Taro_046215, partial [Colocasia esculenta]|nr:hypothetical protein [Colocasia esculenta]